MKNFSRPSRAPFFPMMIDMQGREILIVGGGSVGTRRAETLLRCGAKITAVSLKFNEAFPKVFKKISRAFMPEDIQEKFFFIIAATNVRKVNKLVRDIADEKKIPVNVCDDQSECDFFFPSLINVDNIAVSVCTAGYDVGLTRKLSDRLRKLWPSWINEEIQAVTAEKNFCVL